MAMERLSRRSLLARAAAATAVVAGGAVLRRQGVAEAVVRRPSCIWGCAAELGYADLEAAIGRTFAGNRLNAAFDYTMPDPRLLATYDAGAHWTYHNCNSQRWKDGVVDGVKEPVPWASVAAGEMDVWLAAQAAGIRDNPRWTAANPYHFSFHHEQSVATDNQTGGGGAGTPGEYIAAFRHVRAVFDGAGATVTHGGNVAFCFVPTITQYHGKVPGWGVPDLDPGPAYYELLGVDAYNRRDRKTGLLKTAKPGPWIRPVHDYAVAIGKQFFFGELGIEDGTTTAAHQERAAFTTDLCTTVAKYGRHKPGSCVAMIWTHNITAGRDWRLDLSAEALAAFTAAGSDPFYSLTV